MLPNDRKETVELEFETMESTQIVLPLVLNQCCSEAPLKILFQQHRSNCDIRRCRLNVRFARKQRWQGDYGYQPEWGRQVYHCPFFYGRSEAAAVSACRSAHSIRLRPRRAALMAPYVMDSPNQARRLPTPSAAAGLGGAASHAARAQFAPNQCRCVADDNIGSTRAP
jgi:hypothetical protein